VTWSRCIGACSNKPLDCSIANAAKRRVRKPPSAKDGIEAKVVPHGRKLAVIGLGYVGLPVAVAFGREGIRVIGFDIDPARIAELKAGRERTCEVEPHDLARSNLVLTSDPGELNSADFFIVTVPTPIDQARRPDLTALLRASSTVGKALKKGDIVVYESTVYPGATEEDCVPVLEQVSGLLAGRDFTVGYSPERINPGDKAHRFETITKVIAGQDARTLDIVAAVYGSVITAGLHKAPSIKVAEAAKVIENAQRDLNIAFMNELSAIFHQLGIDTGDVLSAAGTKWNFLNFTPGLVGGHCIGVDPYYLTYRAQKAGYHPDVILAGRRINDSIGVRVARECLRWLLKGGAAAPCVTVLGLTFKENVVDIRNSQVFDIVRELQSFGVSVQVNDPLADSAAALKEYGLSLTSEPQPADAVILAVPHDMYRNSGWPLIMRLLKQGRGLVMDLKGVLDPVSKPTEIDVWRL
jgi:UDP-N-acetyl-D-glucosamine/UDP-N-acetyl-D-galactosamine dehydrogenase